MPIESYVLINTDTDKTIEVLEALSELESVSSAHSVTGPYDIIAAIQVRNLSR
ncbi:Lrp/AsnC ligand binding domain-containing protein, partial [Chloroflexota bacterium]